jgi:aspartyl-tRNA(Asn)/glutamyl-tRNA(Gln) amidotransferase subunit A
MKEEFNKAFSQYDMLFSPVTPEPAFGLGEMINNPLAIDLQDILRLRQISLEFCSFIAVWVY